MRPFSVLLAAVVSAATSGAAVAKEQQQVLRAGADAEMGVSALATAAGQAVPVIPGVGMTCHPAVWFWAAKAAGSAKTDLEIMNAIAAMVPQASMLELLDHKLAQGPLDITQTDLPAAGHVLVWKEAPTHSAVVTAAGITGYNQAGFMNNVANAGYTHLTKADVKPAYKMVYAIPDTVVVAHARGHIQ
jgi:hypothetical protein